MTTVAAVNRTDPGPEVRPVPMIRTNLYDLMEAVMDELLPHEEQHAAWIVNRLLAARKVQIVAR